MERQNDLVGSLDLTIIGVGNMGEALLRGLLQQGIVPAAAIVGVEKHTLRAKEIAERYGIRTTYSVAEGCAGADMIVLAVKPQDADPVLDELSPGAAGKILVSVCAGVTLSRLSSRLPEDTAVVRVMPNAPALIGCGASVYFAGPRVDDEARAVVEAVLGAVGEVHRVEKEALLDAVTGLSGSGPAYAYVFLEALADAGVLMGLSRDLSRALACQTLLGAARMARESGLHTAELKDRVASPGGTTIAGLRELERTGFRGALFEAVRAATLRSRELGG
jgi:pyrroline-5-carboxylate reductase